MPQEEIRNTPPTQQLAPSEEVIKE